MSFPAKESLHRRAFFGTLSVGLAALLSGCAADRTNAGGGAPAQGPTASPEPMPVATKPLPPIPSPHPGPSVKLSRGNPGPDKRICLTVDDGDNPEVVAGYVEFARRTGIHLTFSPNGIYGHSWAPHADVLKPLIENDQIQIMNHTFSHLDLRKMTPQQITAELDRNDEWVQRNFGITTRPYYRPPFGFHDERIDGVAAGLGYTRVMMWSGSYSDSEVITPQFLLAMAQRYLQPGVVVLGHANHPTVLGLFSQLDELIRQRDLTPVTLDEMFGTSRATG